LTSANAVAILGGMVRTEEEARERLGAMADRLYICVRKALDVYRGARELAAFRAILTKRSHSSNVNDLIWANLRSDFDGEFLFTERNNRRLMHVGNDFNIRVKKLNPKMRPQNQITQLVLDFLHQNEQLPGVDVPTNVDLAYRLAGIAELDLHVYVRCPRSGTAAHWTWELEEPARAAVASPEVPPEEPPAPPRRARPRRDDEETPGEEPSGGSADD
jgi:hypothetical protein